MQLIRVRNAFQTARMASGVIALTLAMAMAGEAAAADRKVLSHGPDVTANNERLEEERSRDAHRLLRRIVGTRDNDGGPFAIVDKAFARIYVYGGDGKQKSSSPILLGLAKGDDSVPGIGERKMADIKPRERTTPAGRFKTEPGRNADGEDIVWVDYDAAVSMHRVRTANKADRRLERLATPSVADNRISYGCINVPAAFYDAYLRDTLGAVDGVVYILPETRSLEAQFGVLMTSGG